MKCYRWLISLELKAYVLGLELRIKLLQSTEHIGPTISRDGVDPSASGCFFWIKASSFLPHLEHHLLNELIGMRR